MRKDHQDANAGEHLNKTLAVHNIADYNKKALDDIQAKLDIDTKKKQEEFESLQKLLGDTVYPPEFVAQSVARSHAYASVMLPRLFTQSEQSGDEVSVFDVLHLQALPKPNGEKQTFEGHSKIDFDDGTYLQLECGVEQELIQKKVVDNEALGFAWWRNLRDSITQRSTHPDWNGLDGTDAPEGDRQDAKVHKPGGIGQQGKHGKEGKSGKRGECGECWC
jgi:hypothetical protein